MSAKGSHEEPLEAYKRHPYHTHSAQTGLPTLKPNCTKIRKEKTQ
jgi:hypothetical protein